MLTIISSSVSLFHPCHARVPGVRLTAKSRRGNKAVDLSVPFRLSGLSAGAKLHLVFKSKTPSVINLSLQLPSGERIPSQFPNNISVWQILRQYESGKAGEGRNLNLTQRGYPVVKQGGGRGLLLHEMPVVTIVQRELRELEDFKKTLSQLGFTSGPVLVRVNFRKTSLPLHQAMEKVDAIFADQDDLSAEISMPKPTHSKPNTDEPKPSRPRDQLHEPTSEQPTGQPTTEQPDLPSSTPLAKPPLQDQANLTSSKSRALSSADSEPPQPSNDPLVPTHIFAAPSNNTPAAAGIKFNEANYVPTMEHATMHQHRLQQSSQNKRLPSDREIEAKTAAKAARLKQIKSVDLRVRFPDNTSADWTFGPSDTGARLYEAVRSVMVNPGLGFHLSLPPSVRVRDAAEGPNDLLIQGYELKGRVLLNLVLDNSAPGARQGPFLKPEFSRRAEQVYVAPEPADVKDDNGKKHIAKLQSLGSSMAKEVDSVAKKLPKWFRPGGKK